MATYPTYVVNQDWTTFTAHQPGASYTGNPNTYVYAETGFGSIYETIVDGNMDAPTKVAGAVGVAGTPDDNLASPLDLTKGYTIAVVKGDFNEDVFIPATSTVLDDDGQPTAETAVTSYTLDFSSLYNSESLRTKFVGSIESDEGTINDVGVRVSKGIVEFGKFEYVPVYKQDNDGNFLDENGEIIDLEAEGAEDKKVVIGQENIAPATTITLAREVSTTSQCEFIVGGDYRSDYANRDPQTGNIIINSDGTMDLTGVTLPTAEAIVQNTVLTVNNGVWVGSGPTNKISPAYAEALGNTATAFDAGDYDTFQLGTDALRYTLTVEGSFIGSYENDDGDRSALLTVRNNGTMTMTDSFAEIGDFVFRNNVALTDSVLDAQNLKGIQSRGGSNIYSEDGHDPAVLTATGSDIYVEAKGGFQIGHATKAGRKGEVVLKEESSLFANILTVETYGTLTVDATSKVYVAAQDIIDDYELAGDGTLTNKGIINITVYDDVESLDDEDWIIADQFINTVGTLKIDTKALTTAEWEGVKRVVYAENADETGVDEDNIIIVDATDDDAEAYEIATSKGKVAIAKGVDFRVLYVNHDNDEDVQFAQTVPVDFKLTAEGEITDDTTDYYVAFNAFSDAGKAIAKRKNETTPADKKPTQIILLDGTSTVAEDLAYSGGDQTQDFDGLTFLRYGENDVSVTMGAGTEENPKATAERVIVKGFTVGEGVTFAADRVVQLGAEAVTTINGTLNVIESDVLVVPTDPTKGYVPSFRVGGGTLEFTAGSTLTGDGNLDVNATNRYDEDVIVGGETIHKEGDPIPAVMTVDGANVNLHQLTIGSNATVILSNMKIADAIPATTNSAAVPANPGAVFEMIQLKNPLSADFDKPTLKLRNTDVTVTDVFDSRNGIVDMNMYSTLRVTNDPNPVIGGGTFNLSVIADYSTSQDDEGNTTYTYTGDLEEDLGFYKLVYAGLNQDPVNGVTLACYLNGSTVATANYGKQDGKVLGEYIYSSLDGKGLFVLRESIYLDLYVDADWKAYDAELNPTGYMFGDTIVEGDKTYYFGVNAFTTITDALTEAAGRNADGVDETTQEPIINEKTTRIHVLDVPAVADEEDAFFGYPDPIIIKGNVTLADGDALLSYATDMGIMLNPAAGKTFTVGKEATLTTARGDIYFNFAKNAGTIQIDGAVAATIDPDAEQKYSQILTYGETIVSSTGSLKSANLLWLAPGKADKVVATRNNKVAITGATTWTVENPQVSASVLMYTSGDVYVSDTFINVRSLYFSKTDDDSGTAADKLTSSNTTWTIASDFRVEGAATIMVDNEQVEIAARGGTATFSGDTINVLGSTTTDNNVPAGYGKADPVSGDVELLSPDFTMVLEDGTELNVAGKLTNEGNLEITSSTVAVGYDFVVDEGDEQAVPPMIGDETAVEAKFLNNGTVTMTGSTTAPAVIDGAVLNTGNIIISGVANVTYGITNFTGGDTAELVKGNVTFTVDSDNLSGAKLIRMVEVEDDGLEAVDTFRSIFASIDGGDVTLKKGVTFDFGITVTSTEFAAIPDDDSTAEVNESRNAAVFGATVATLWNGNVIVDDEAAIEKKAIILKDTTAATETFPEAGRNTLTIEAGTAKLATDLTVAGLTLNGGELYMNWDKLLTVKGVIATPETPVPVISIDTNTFLGLIDQDKKVIDQTFGANDTVWTDEDYAKILKPDDPEHPETAMDYFKVIDGDLYLDASAFAKVSKFHEQKTESGWYNFVNNVYDYDDDDNPELVAPGAADAQGVKKILILDGDYSGDNYGWSTMNGITTVVLGNTDESWPPEDYDGDYAVPILPSGNFAGGTDVYALAPVNPAIGGLEIKYAGNKPTSLTINTGISEGNIIGGDIFDSDGSTYFYREGGTKLEITGGTFAVADGSDREIIGGVLYYGGCEDYDADELAYDLPNGTAVIAGDVNVTISGGTFKGYNVYGGNSAFAKKTGKYTTVDGDVTITLNTTDNALEFAQNGGGDTGKKALGGYIYAGSKGSGIITGDAEVILKGGNALTFKKMFGGSTGDYRTKGANGAIGALESSIDGDRILTFNGFSGALTGEIEGFTTVQFIGSNEMNFANAVSDNFNADVTEWIFALDAETEETKEKITFADGNQFAFDFSGDKVDLTGCYDGFTLANVTSIEDADFGALAGNVSWDEESQVLTLHLA